MRLTDLEHKTKECLHTIRRWIESSQKTTDTVVRQKQKENISRFADDWLKRMVKLSKTIPMKDILLHPMRFCRLRDGIFWLNSEEIDLLKKPTNMIQLIQNDEVKQLVIEMGQLSDGYHTFDELYDYRKVYNALLFNEWAKQGLYNVHKSKRHSDGEECFGGGWFVVSATLPTGQVTNHYELKDWDLFKVEEREMAEQWDGHTPQDAYQRMLNFCSADQ